MIHLNNLFLKVFASHFSIFYLVLVLSLSRKVFRLQFLYRLDLFQHYREISLWWILVVLINIVLWVFKGLKFGAKIDELTLWMALSFFDVSYSSFAETSKPRTVIYFCWGINNFDLSLVFFQKLITYWPKFKGFLQTSKLAFRRWFLYERPVLLSSNGDRSVPFLFATHTWRGLVWALSSFSPLFYFFLLLLHKSFLLLKGSQAIVTDLLSILENHGIHFVVVHHVGERDFMHSLSYFYHR